MKWEQRNQSPEAEKHEQKDPVCTWPGKDTVSSHGLEFNDIEGAILVGNHQIKPDQADQQNDAPDRQIDRNLPGGRLPVSSSPDADHQERGDQRQLVEGIEKE